MKRFLAASALVLSAVAVPGLSADAPRVSVAAMTDLPVVERSPYDEKADAVAAVDAAFARAKKSHKRVLIDLGGNWCGDCIVLANIMALKEVKPFIASKFEVVAVDVGRFDKNLAIPARFGITSRLEGVPAVIVAEPDGTFVNKGKITALSDARHMSPQAVVDWLAQWAK
ncbi:thiol-disulfide isomerase/thioredoxin [Rhizomicrobium palustre]|jgi:thiol-disulfide isomerase/thioredoxin|uniref:Thiol-disulfide isomerase/thioredoxin n=1 Tax=Rhizomicrobium palustre TaxID=189966 RepID=A0A846MYD6_9PROT|nr:thioredoxin family protein [Rhizomicrobium palustre]NIK88010.1 thiol-disulfide isomerase/thioredoxin [Rhizomicrobium palustre]